MRRSWDDRALCRDPGSGPSEKDSGAAMGRGGGSSTVAAPRFSMSEAGFQSVRHVPGEGRTAITGAPHWGRKSSRRTRVGESYVPSTSPWPSNIRISRDAGANRILARAA